MRLPFLRGENMEKLTIGGVVMPPIAYNGATKSRNKVWAPNSGRANNGEMIGTLVAVKSKWEFTFVPLSEDQVDVVEQAISSLDKAFVTVTFERNSGRKEEFIAYSGDISYPLVWDTANKTYYKGVKVSLIEK